MVDLKNVWKWFDFQWSDPWSKERENFKVRRLDGLKRVELEGQPQRHYSGKIALLSILGGPNKFWNLPWAPEALPDFSILTSVLLPQLHQEVEVLMKQKEILQTWSKFNFKWTKLHLMQIMYKSSWILDKSLHLKNKQKTLILNFNHCPKMTLNYQWHKIKCFNICVSDLRTSIETESLDRFIGTQCHLMIDNNKLYHRWESC